MLSDPSVKTQLLSAIRNDLATLLGINLADITITALRSASLQVDFTVTSINTESQINATLTSGMASTAWLSQTSALYASSNPESAPISMTSSTLSAAPVDGPSESSGSGGMIAGIVCGVVALAGIIGIVVYMRSSAKGTGQQQQQKGRNDEEMYGKPKLDHNML